jgi:hypothetical protein
MRVLDLAAGIAALCLVTPGALSAQSFGDAAAKEKARRKAAEAKAKKPAPTFTNDDLGRSDGGGSASFAEGGTAEGADKDKSKKDGAAGDKTAEKSDDDKQAEAAALWHKNVDTANKNVTIFRDTVNRIQADLNDTSGGFYSARRTTLMNLQEETKKKLADAERLVADLEDQGRRSGYR